MSNNIELILDIRERHLISELEKYFTVKTEQLELGDIIFKKDDEIIIYIISLINFFDKKTTSAKKR